ncbi:MAG: PepSY domain-containing protein [Planctomycetota bacterium]
MNFKKTNRVAHRWATVVVAFPVLVMLVTGMLLQWKKQSSWIQPATQEGVANTPIIGFDRILVAAQGVDEAGIASWGDIDRLDVRPSKGVAKVRSNSGWEVQVDTQTGVVLSSAYRRSDLIESLHDGSFFGEGVKLWVFFPSAAALTLMWGTGVYLFALPHVVKRKRRLARAPGSS